jgi:hypothetical protein
MDRDLVALVEITVRAQLEAERAVLAAAGAAQVLEVGIPST